MSSNKNIIKIGTRILKRISKHKEDITFVINLATAFFTLLTVIFALLALQDARVSSGLAERNVNITTEIAKWYYEPQPQMNIWTSVDYELNESGAVYVDTWFDYVKGKGFDISKGIILSGYTGSNGSGYFFQAPSYLACCKNIKIVVYNSGRSSIIYPLFFLDLEAKNKTDGVLFKVHTVRTAVNKLEYNPEQKLILESSDFVENKKIDMLYPAVDNDFPPYLDENGNSYFAPPDFSKELLPFKPFVNRWTERSDMLGPFGIGDIKPGESAEIELKIFSTGDDCIEGSLNISVQSLNTGISNRIINLKTGRRDTCKDREEYEKYIKSRYS